MDQHKLNLDQLPESSRRSTDEKQSILAAIVATCDDIIISETLDGIITSWNPSAEQMFGYSESEAIGQHISIIIATERLDEETLNRSQIAQGKRFEHFETVMRARDGSLIELSLSLSPIKSSDGTIIGASKIARSIRHRNISDESQAVLAAIIANSDDAIVSKTLEGIITSWNPAAVRMFGYSMDEALGKHISLIIPEDRLDEENVIIGNIARGNKVDHFQTVRQAKDGTQIPISVTVSPITDRYGTVIGASKIARDISEQKADEIRKNDFIGMVSHELKTPLTSLTGYLQMLQEKAELGTDPMLSKVLDRSVNQVRKMAIMINGFLNVSRLESGKIHIEKKQFDMADLVKETEEDFKITVSSHHLIFAPVIKTFVDADRDKISQVINNFISNALKYSPRGSTIRIACLTIGKEVQVSVKDEGSGVSQENQTHLFERYYRVKGASTENVSGFGIGLYLCSEIIRRHSGKIWVKSEIGAGSTFFFSLPL